MSADSITTKLAAARTRLILDKPFLGALVLRLPLEPADPDWCPTTATDARKFYFNPSYVEALSLDETQFVLAHEALHCALSHFARRGHRIKHRWDIACDYAINPILVDEGLTPPPGSLMMNEYRGMTAEEIYPLIDDDGIVRRAPLLHEFNLKVYESLSLAVAATYLDDITLPIFVACRSSATHTNVRLSRQKNEAMCVSSSGIRSRKPPPGGVHIQVQVAGQLHPGLGHPPARSAGLGLGATE